MELNADDLSLTSLCSRYRNGLSVPDFQRGYSWTAQQIEQFWSDITSVAEDRYSDHFIGPVVILKSETRAQVVDGQQRLTTIVILSSIIRDTLIMDYSDPYNEIDGNKEYLSQKLNQIFFLSDLSTPYFDGNQQIKSVLNGFIIKHPKSQDRKRFEEHWDLLSPKEKRHSKPLCNAHKVLTESLKSWLVGVSPSKDAQKKSLNKLIDAVLERLHFLSIEVGSEDDAFAIFETLNERGLKLSPADLLKSYILRRVLQDNPASDRDAISASWDQITDYLDEYDVSNFLRHYLLTLHDSSIQKKVIFKKFREEIEPTPGSRTPVAAHRKLEEIKYAAQCYGQLLNTRTIVIDNSNLDNSLRKLNMIGDSHRVFLLAVMLKGFSTEDLLIATRNVETLLFRWVVCGKNAQVLENLFQTGARSLREGDSESLKEACKTLVSASPSDEEFGASLRQSASRDTRLQAYAYRSICRGLTGSEVTTDRQEVSVEHIAPRNPEGDYWYQKIASKEASQGDTSQKIYEDYVYMWGNITILERPLNSSVRNGAWEIKKNGQGRYKGYFNSTIPTTRHLLGIEEWNTSELLSRNEWFVVQALKYWKREFSLFAYPTLNDYSN